MVNTAKDIRKIIIPVAGYGTRFLPATKAQPKEMLTVVDKPVIQYIVEEAKASGIKDVILVTSQNKRAVEDHFDRNFELEYRLKEKGNLEQLRRVVEISELANFFYVRQKIPLGDGDAILQARDLINEEPFAVAFGDVIVKSRTACLGQLINVWRRLRAPIIAVDKVEKNEIKKFGIIGGERTGERITRITSIVEKPEPGRAPSNLAITGRYILIPEILDILLEVKRKRSEHKGELRLVDAFNIYIKKNPIYAYEFNGKRYDCGSKTGFLEAIIDFALEHKDLRKVIKAKNI